MQQRRIATAIRLHARLGDPAQLLESGTSRLAGRDARAGIGEGGCRVCRYVVQPTACILPITSQDTQDICSGSHSNEALHVPEGLPLCKRSFNGCLGMKRKKSGRVGVDKMTQTLKKDAC